MSALRLVDTTPGNYSLLLDVGTTSVDDTVAEAGFEPNGYFWEGVAQLLIRAESPGLESRLSFDPEGSMFCAFSKDKAALEELRALMEPAAANTERMRALIAEAEAKGFEFDD